MVSLVELVIRGDGLAVGKWFDNNIVWVVGDGTKTFFW
jgi:hypothetical protein